MEYQSLALQLVHFFVTKYFQCVSNESIVHNMFIANCIDFITMPSGKYLFKVKNKTLE